MLKISAELESLSPAQRESLAGFILSYPNTLPHQVTDNKDDDAVVIPAFSVAEDLDAIFDAEAAAIFGKAIEPAPAAGPVLVPSPMDDRLDKNGIPWDERIHASSRAKTTDGCWRKKRGVEDATVTQVEAELKALMGLPVVAAPCKVCNSTAPGHVTGGVACISPTVAIPPPPPVASVVEDRQAYVTLISKASAAIGAKKLTAEQLAAAVIAAGVPSLPLLANRLDLVPQVMAAIEAIIG
jgi:hypothetical protein